MVRNAFISNGIFINNFVLIFVFIYRKMAPCGVETGKEKEWLQGEYNCSKRVWFQYIGEKGVLLLSSSDF